MTMSNVPQDILPSPMMMRMLCVTERRLADPCYADGAGNGNWINGDKPPCAAFILRRAAVYSCSSDAPRHRRPREDSAFHWSRASIPGRWFTVRRTCRAGKYKSILVDDADIYRASDADFGATSEADKASGELLDAETGEALAGFVATESPIALDLTSGLGKLRAAELGIERGSEEFARALDRFLNRNRG